jgi:hypothetical protein
VAHHRDQGPGADRARRREVEHARRRPGDAHEGEVQAAGARLDHIGRSQGIVKKKSTMAILSHV